MMPNIDMNNIDDLSAIKQGHLCIQIKCSLQLPEFQEFILHP